MKVISDGKCEHELEIVINLCHHIKTLTGVHTAVLNIPSKAFLLPPYRKHCRLCNSSCEAYYTHLYGAYEAERWGGKYIYYCPRGLVFLAVPPIVLDSVMDYCVIVGPVIMSNSADEPFDDPADMLEELAGVPWMTTAQARSLSELTAAAVASCALNILSPDVDSGNLAKVLQLIYDSAEESVSKPYPIERERQLHDAVRGGNKAEAQEVLNELLAHIYGSANNDLQLIKSRVRDLLVLMSRAAIDGGADMDEIFDLCFRYEQDSRGFTNLETLNRWISSILHKFVSLVFDLTDIRHKNVLFKATAYIKEHLADKLTLEQVAEQVYLSKSYFFHIIKEDLGCTYTEYVNRLRIDCSKPLLKSTDMSISEITYAVGFGDQSYFTRIFKKRLGMSPGEYRKQCRI